ncbi:hypothetical protein B9J78_00455 [bacterium Unc6]|nr:hypothetical protein [bacterium Unc6]
MFLPNFSVRRPVAITMLIMVVVLLGAISLSRLGIDMFPDIEYPMVSVVSTYPGVVPEDMEELVTKPIEEVVATVSGVKKIRSVSYEGISVVMAEFVWGTNLDFAAQDMREAISLIEVFLPEDMKRPLVIKFDLAMWPIMMFGITGERDLFDLRDLIDDVIKPRLERIEGVASVMLFGGLEREFLVEVDGSRLEAHNLSLFEIAQALERENLNLPAGHLIEGPREFLVRTVGEFEGLYEIRRTVVSLREGKPIYLEDIAVISDTHKELRGHSRVDRRDGLLIAINRESGANTVRIAQRVEEELIRLKKDLPADIRLHELFNQAKFIRASISGVVSSGLWGGLAAIFVLFLFLRKLRPTITIALAIPLAGLATFIPIYSLGYTLNMMTLGGLALAVGMLLDNAIVVIENIFRHLKEGKEPKEAAQIGTSEVAMAISASTLTTVVVFLPMAYATGIAGKMAQALGVTVGSALIVSLFVALTLVPMVASKLLKNNEKKVVKEKETGGWFAGFKERYMRVLALALKHRAKVILTAAAIFVLSLGLLLLVGTEFIPRMDSGIYIGTLRMPVDTSLPETNRVVQTVEAIIADIPEIEASGVFVGLHPGGELDLAFGFGITGVNEAQLMGELLKKEERKRSTEEILTEIRSRLPQDIEGLSTSFIEFGPAAIMGGAGAAPINIKLFGKDLVVLEELSRTVMERIKGIEGIHSIDTTLKPGKPELAIKIDRERASRKGLGVAEVAQAVQTAMRGRVDTRFREAGKEIDIRLRLREEDRETLTDIGLITVPSPRGTLVHLGELAKIHPERGPAAIFREERVRVAEVNAQFSGRNLGEIMDEVRGAVAGITIPSGYFIEYGGEYEDMVETFYSLLFVLLLAVLLVYMVMAAQFESLIHPFAIIFSVPLALIGVVLALLVTGKTISLVSFIGMIMVTGIVVNNAIVFIDYINQLRAKGLSRDKAIIQAGGTRLRAILMTASTTMLAMLPLTLGRAMGVEVRSAMAVAIIGGLFASTLLTLIVIPTIYSLLDDLAHRGSRSVR